MLPVSKLLGHQCSHLPVSRPCGASSGARQHSRRQRQTAVFTVASAAANLERGDDGQARSPIPPTVADTKAKFYKAFSTPIPSIYNNVILELLVQQHLMRYNTKYQYDPVFALGFVSVFDQVLDGMPGKMASNKEKVFQSYIESLDEDPKQYRQDSSQLEGWAKELGSPDQLTPSSDGSDIQKALSGIAQRAKDGKFQYTRFFAIGLFRLLELTKAKDPKALEKLAGAMNVSLESINRDLTTYKGVLSKLNAAKELMKEFIEREKRKQKEREEQKSEAAKAAEAKKELEEKEGDKVAKPATDVLKA